MANGVAYTPLVGDIGRLRTLEAMRTDALTRGPAPSLKELKWVRDLFEMNIAGVRRAQFYDVVYVAHAMGIDGLTNLCAAHVAEVLNPYVCDNQPIKAKEAIVPVKRSKRNVRASDCPPRKRTKKMSNTTTPCR